RWRAEGKWLRETSRKSVSQSVFCGACTYCALNTVPPLEDDHGNSNSSHVKIFLPKKLLECLPKCSSLPREMHPVTFHLSKCNTLISSKRDIPLSDKFAKCCPFLY
uniref:Uncharacterized protein n=1 Tax=Sus scrofa TaxID=9823 RepID=A0A8D0RRS3_PIG